MPRKVGIIAWLEDRVVASNAPAWADIPRALAGMSRVLHELATGENPVVGDPPATLPNPQGYLGVDLSGPPYGTAPIHSIATLESYNDSSANVLAYAATSKAVAVVPGPGARLLTSRELVAINNRLDTMQRMPWSFWVRPFSRSNGGDAPYSRGYLSITARRVSGSGAIDLLLVAKGKADDDHRAISGVFSVSTSSEATTTDVLWLPLTPGLNSFFITAVNPGAADVEITRVEIRQAVKRRHTI
jgi:hypothetical protein